MRGTAQRDRVCNSLYDDKMSYRIQYTPVLLHHVMVLDELNRWSQLVSQSELISKRSKGVSLAGGARGDGGVEQRIESQ